MTWEPETWEPEGNKIADGRLGSLEPVEVLFEFEGEPLTFVARDPDGGLLLLHDTILHDVMAFHRTTRYVVSAIDSRILGDLKAGRIDILTALRQPRCWVADVVGDGSVKALWRVEFSSIPEKVLPRPGAMIAEYVRRDRVRARRRVRTAGPQGRPDLLAPRGALGPASEERKQERRYLMAEVHQEAFPVLHQICHQCGRGQRWLLHERVEGALQADASEVLHAIARWEGWVECVDERTGRLVTIGPCCQHPRKCAWN
ncbi:MAG: hypothetical protein IRY99_19535 [Isosphaeraceae bacterium]|nr:hypothetical protein [Isosphaeraceae bacterium]